MTTYMMMMMNLKRVKNCRHEEAKRYILDTIEILNKQKINPKTNKLVPENIRALNSHNKNDVYDLGFGKLDLNGEKILQDTIIIGGNKLSRGIVVEGLNVSYYLRSAKEQKADTVTQMGRWYGYRNDYADLIRIFATDNLISDLKWTANVNESVRQKAIEYQIKKISPKFSAILQTFGGFLTSRAKSGAIKSNNNFSNKSTQVLSFFTQDQIRNNNVET